MRQSADKILRRLIALDRQLKEGNSDGVNVTKFAQKWGVDYRTIMRDLDRLRRFGGDVIAHQHDEGGRDVRRWRYRNGAWPLFAANIPKKWLKSTEPK
ncbi:MAG: HTH domain-containing protein [Planctomycetaceae bacterium]|nr:HTH domain-containing protein [Planctomycetaceae bacterium]